MRPRCTEARGPAKAERRRASFWKAKSASATERSGPSVSWKGLHPTGPKISEAPAETPDGKTGFGKFILRSPPPKTHTKRPNSCADTTSTTALPSLPNASASFNTTEKSLMVRAGMRKRQREADDGDGVAWELIAPRRDFEVSHSPVERRIGSI